jgi:hypothetical protein
MLKNAQHSYTSALSPLGLRNKEHHSRAVIPCSKKRINVIEIWFSGRWCVVEVQCILNRTVTNDEICVCLKLPVLAVTPSLLASFICSLSASFSYLLVTHGEAD